MATLKNEVAISKCCSVKLDDETIAIIGLFYHTADRKENPDDKSWYRYEVRVEKIKNLEDTINDMMVLENRLKPWRWTNPTWNDEWFMGYDKSNDQYKGAKFLKMKIRKMLSWDAYIKLVTEGVKMLGNGTVKTYPTAKYECDGYEDIDGITGLSITDKQTLLDHVGKPMWKKLVLKRDLS